MQRNFYSPTEEVNKEVFWALVEAPSTHELIDKFRATGDAEWKRKLPAFIFQASFDVTTSKAGVQGRWRKQSAARLTGLVVMDVDHLGDDEQRVRNAEFRSEAFAARAKELGILLVYITPSGRGLKIVFKADAEVGNLIENQRKMAVELGLTIDEACKDASRMSFICRREDILFINEEELFTYENKAFGEMYDGYYRSLNSEGLTPEGLTPEGLSPESLSPESLSPESLSPESLSPNPSPVGEGGINMTVGTIGDKVSTPLSFQSEDEGKGAEASYHGIPYSSIINAWLGGQAPGKGDRHNTLLKLATDLRYITDNNAGVMKSVLSSLDWVQQLVSEGDSLDAVIKSALDYRYYQNIPKKMQSAIAKAGNQTSESEGAPASALPEAAPAPVLPLVDCNSALSDITSALPLQEWGEQIQALQSEFPCLKEVCDGLDVPGYPAALFVSSSFFGTLMTRTTYRFYHRPEELRRLNYCVMIIGHPASGKSFATRLYDLLAAPIREADKVGYDAINRYKKERQERTTSSKAQKGEALKKPEVIIRNHPARTSNATFINDMNTAVEMVDGTPLHLHMLTFDTELDNATFNQKGGSWIDKSAMELKAFHNEEDGQAYTNLDSVSGTFKVYWNFVYTGTPLSLSRKVTERNFGSGLATRLAVIPMPSDDFKMMPLTKQSTYNTKSDNTLKAWAFKLDEVHGELPLWPLVEHCWKWLKERMEIAEFNKDRAEAMLLKRVPYYGLTIAAPYIIMRHWEEWQEKHTLTIDDTDVQLSTLAMDIQYASQKLFFAAYAQAYYDNLDRNYTASRQRPSRYDECYKLLPNEFTVDDIANIYGIEKNNAYTTATRLKNRNCIENITRGYYRKLKQEVI